MNRPWQACGPGRFASWLSHCPKASSKVAHDALPTPPEGKTWRSPDDEFDGTKPELEREQMDLPQASAYRLRAAVDGSRKACALGQLTI